MTGDDAVPNSGEHNPEVIRLPRFDYRLMSIAEYLAYESRDVELGIRFLECADKTIKLVAAMPNAGSRCKVGYFKARGLRFSPVHEFPKYTIFYEVTSLGDSILKVTFVTIHHGMRDLETILEGEEG